MIMAGQFRLFSPCLLIKRVFDVEDPEWVDPYATDFYPEVVPSARDPIFNSVLAGSEAEAMILNTGETFPIQLKSPRPWQLRSRLAFSVTTFR